MRIASLYSASPVSRGVNRRDTSPCGRRKLVADSHILGQAPIDQAQPTTIRIGTALLVDHHDTATASDAGLPEILPARFGKVVGLHNITRDEVVACFRGRAGARIRARDRNAQTCAGRSADCTADGGQADERTSDQARAAANRGSAQCTILR